MKNTHIILTNIKPSKTMEILKTLPLLYYQEIHIEKINSTTIYIACPKYSDKSIISNHFKQEFEINSYFSSADPQNFKNEHPNLFR